MKKLWALILSFVIFFLCLTGCGLLHQPDGSSQRTDPPRIPGPSCGPVPADASSDPPESSSEPEKDALGYVVGDYRDPVADGTVVPIVSWIEGEREEDDGLHLSSPLGVALDYDPECFDVASNGAEDGVLQLTGLYNNGTADVLFTVERADGPFEDALTRLLPAGAERIEEGSDTVGGRPAQCWHYAAGDQWNSPRGVVYGVECDGQGYLIGLRWYQAASEGYGARLAAMLETVCFLEKAEAG